MKDFGLEPADLEPALDAVIVMDTKGGIVDWSPAAEKLFGWSRQEAVGRLAPSLLVPDRFRDAFWEGFKKLSKAASSGVPGVDCRVEITSLRKQGGEFEIELVATRLDLAGKPFYLGIARDLTLLREERQQAYRKSIQSRLMHQASALSSAGDTFDEALRTCIESLCTATNWPLGHAFIPEASRNQIRSTDIWHMDDDERLDAFDPGRLPERYGPGEGFVGRIWKSGKPVWIDDIAQDETFLRREMADLGIRGAFGFPVIVENEVVAVLEFFSWEPIEPDPPMLILIENLKEQLGRFIERREWMEERARLAAIVDSSYDAIIGKDLDGRIISWNTGAEQMYGYPAEDALGQPFALILPEGIEQEEAQIRDVTRTGARIEQFETKRRCQDGTIIDVALTVSPIRDSRGRIVGASTIERDITHRKQRERELRLAKREAERANQAKNEFLANISHELRTPMNAILGMIHLSLGEDLSDVLRDYLATARDSAHDLLYLLNDLLDFSRMEAGHFELEHEPFRLHDTLNAAMRALSLRASEKGLELACHISQDAPRQILGDGVRLRQIIVNLTGNAIKFTDQGEVIVRVGVVSREKGQVLLEFSVEDTGRGISAKDQEQIFAPFTQVDASTTRTETGTGLGLAIVKELVEKMGGRVELESELGRGSRFHFRVPFEIVKEDLPEQVEEELSDLPVLVVDDNRTNRVILKETLAGWSMRPTVVESADRALTEIQRADRGGQPFPLLLIDALMPEMDGFKLLETLKEERDDSLMPIAVLMLSSADRQTFKMRCRDLDVAAYLEKPVSQSELLETILKVLDLSPLKHGTAPRLEPTRRKLKVLLAEDTPANQKVVRAILEKRGHRVVVADNGREAVDQLQQEPFDVVLMDVQMPILDGLQATQTIRELADGSLSEIPIIAMTAHARREDRRKCLAAGMDSYLSKPIDAAKLIQLVETTKRRPPGYMSSDTWERPPVKPVANQPGPSINLDAARARMDDDEELIGDLAKFFLEDAPQLVGQIEHALDNGHAEVIQRSAHSLKGMAANFDAEALIIVAIKLEEFGRQSKLEKARRSVPELRQAVRRVSAELEDYLRNHKKS